MVQEAFVSYKWKTKIHLPNSFEKNLLVLKRVKSFALDFRLRPSTVSSLATALEWMFLGGHICTPVAVCLVPVSDPAQEPDDWCCAHRNTNTHLNTPTYRANVLDEFTEGRRRFDLLFVGDDEVLSEFWNQKTIGIEGSGWAEVAVEVAWLTIRVYTCTYIYLFIIHCYGSGRSLQKGYGWQGCNQKLDNFHVGYVEVHRLKEASRGSLQNLSSPFPGRSNDMEHLVCMVFCDNHSIYRTLRFIIKCGNRKSTATVTNGRLEGIWVFTNKLQSFYILHFYEDAESTRFTNSSPRAEKKKGDFQVHLGDFEWWKFITKNFVEHFIPDLFWPFRMDSQRSPKLLMVEKSCRM